MQKNFFYKKMLIYIDMECKIYIFILYEILLFLFFEALYIICNFFKN